MSTNGPNYRGYRYPPQIISNVVWLYHRFCLSLRDVEDLVAERGIVVSYETVRQWCRKFGPAYARAAKRRTGRLGDTWYLDEVFVTIKGRRHYLWRAVDQDGDTLDILVQSRRNQRAAERFFRKLLKGEGASPRQLVTDKLPPLFGGTAHHDAFSAARHGATCQQPGRGFTSADPCARAPDAGFQVARSSAALSGRARGGRKSIPAG
jgi:transposase-like protein